MKEYNFTQGIIVGLLFASPCIIEIIKGLL
jgi:hypothetical protein